MPKITGSATEYLNWLRDQAAKPELDEQRNSLLMFVYRLETRERTYEQSHRLSYAVGRDGIVR